MDLMRPAIVPGNLWEMLLGIWRLKAKGTLSYHLDAETFCIVLDACNKYLLLCLRIQLLVAMAERITLEVALMSGKRADISASPHDTLGSLSPTIAKNLGLPVESPALALPTLSFLLGARRLQETMEARDRDLRNGTVTVVWRDCSAPPQILMIFAEMKSLAARALDASLSVAVQHLRAAQKIKPLAREVLDLLGYPEQDPDSARVDDPKAVLVEVLQVLQLHRPGVAACRRAAFCVLRLVQSLKRYHYHQDQNPHILWRPKRIPVKNAPSTNLDAEPEADTNDAGHKGDRQEQGAGSNIGSAPAEADIFTQPTSSSGVPDQGTASELLEPVAEELEGFSVQRRQLLQDMISKSSCPIHAKLEKICKPAWICDGCRKGIRRWRGRSCRRCNLDICKACIKWARKGGAESKLARVLGFSLHCRSIGKPADAEDALEDAVKQLREQHAESPELAIALRELGTVLKEKGEPAAAKQHLTEALDMERALCGESPNLEVAVTLHELGLVCKEMGELPEAQRLLTEALDMKRAVFGEAPNRSVAVTLHELGLVFKEKGELPEAERLLTEALDMERAIFEGAPNREVALTLHRLGLVLKRKGKLPEAERRLREALVMKRAVFEESPNLEVAVTLHDLGLVFKERGDLAAAKQHLTEALGMERALCGESPNHEMAVTLHELGLVCKEMGELAEAEQHLTEASSIDPAFFETPNRSHELGWGLTEKGKLLAAAGPLRAWN
ncbi:unnamed protein product [Symbiodinium natans]|uniref:Uncharacterized protein n=1 Tax=Symbiodinium natans TaxID=878477 RepID=A0A812TU01_9DINO|nr:unnamed protein product [Symbiodinium natans]